MKRPKQFIIELTNHCNGRCTMCPNRVSTRKREHMDPDLYKRIVLDIKQLGISTTDVCMGLCGVGEPLLHPQFAELVEWTYGQQVPYGVGTNGAILHKYVDLLLACPPEEICFSMDGTRQETYEQMRPGLSLRRLEETTEDYLTRLREAYHVPKKIWVQMIVSRANVAEVNTFIRKWLPYTEPLGGKVSIKCVCPWPHYPVNSLYPSPVPQIDEDLIGQVEMAGFDPPVKYRETCALFNNFLQVLSNGDYVPCCSPTRDYWGIGNARDMRIEQAFNGAVMEWLRKTGKKDIPFCRDCI